MSYEEKVESPKETILKQKRRGIIPSGARVRYPDGTIYRVAESGSFVRETPKPLSKKARRILRRKNAARPGKGI